MTIEELIQKIKSSTQHKTLYHFTANENLDSIKEYGLLSKQKLKEKNLWPPPSPGGNELSRNLDQQSGIDRYVSLCMTQNHPMEYKLRMTGKHITYLKILPEILKMDGVKVAFGIANGNDMPILPIEKAIDGLDINVLYNRTDWSDPEMQARLCTAEKYEVLIPDKVSLKFIR